MLLIVLAIAWRFCSCKSGSYRLKRSRLQNKEVLDKKVKENKVQSLNREVLDYKAKIWVGE